MTPYRRYLLAAVYDGMVTVAFAGIAAVLYASPHPWLCFVAVFLGITRR